MLNNYDVPANQKTRLKSRAWRTDVGRGDILTYCFGLILATEID